MAQWWALNVVEGRELRFCEMLLATAQRSGVVAAGLVYTPTAVVDDPAAAAVLDARRGAASEAGALLPAAAAGGLYGDVGGADGSGGGDPIIAWVPQKRARVYSPSSDKLVEKTVLHAPGRAYVRCVLDDDALAAIASQPFFLGWRVANEYSGLLLERHGMLPPGEERGEVRCLLRLFVRASCIVLFRWAHVGVGHRECVLCKTCGAKR